MTITFPRTFTSTYLMQIWSRWRVKLSQPECEFKLITYDGISTTLMTDSPPLRIYSRQLKTTYSRGLVSSLSNPHLSSSLFRQYRSKVCNYSIRFTWYIVDNQQDWENLNQIGDCKESRVCYIVHNWIHPYQRLTSLSLDSKNTLSFVLDSSRRLPSQIPTRSECILENLICEY